jgi:transposase
MHNLLMDYYRASDYSKEVVSKAELKKSDGRYAAILTLADQEEPPPKKDKRGRPKKSKGRNLMDRFTAYEEAVLAFSRHAEVPFTNNLGERDLRPWKTKLKGGRMLSYARRRTTLCAYQGVLFYGQEERIGRF